MNGFSGPEGVAVDSDGNVYGAEVSQAVIDKGGAEAMQLRIAEQYIGEFGNLAKTGNTFVVPANLADLTSMMALATDIAKRRSGADAG